MTLTVKTFEELSTRELYEILRVRSAVFVVEQDCIYQDMDRRDYRSLHMFYEQDGEVTAYLRAFEKDDEPGTVQIGRVLTAVHGQGLGGQLFHEALQVIRERMKPWRLFLEAQVYAKGFYAREGFRECSEEFLDDGIPHVEMECEG